MNETLKEFIQLQLENVRKLVKAQRFDLHHMKTLKLSDLLNYADANLTLLGQGSTRNVYALNRRVLKIARSSAGRRQNRIEAKKANCKGLKTQVFEVAPNYDWIITEKVKPLSGSKLVQRLKEEVGLSLTQLIKVVSFSIMARQQPNLQYPQRKFHQALYGHNSWYTALVETVVNCDIDIYELHDQNWGLTDDNKLVLLDLGK